MLAEIFWNILLFLIGYVLFKIWISSSRTRIKVRLNRSPVLVKVDRIDNQYYFWNKETDEFLSQGSSMDEDKKNLKLNYPEGEFPFEERSNAS